MPGTISGMGDRELSLKTLPSKSWDSSRGWQHTNKYTFAHSTKTVGKKPKNIACKEFIF
jgi:hypothetical protein